MKDLMNLKIAYIGGGSKQWARVFMNDLALTSSLCGTIALYDIDKEAVILNEKIGNLLAQDSKCVSKWKYVVNDSIDDALENADFVVISILPGTFKEMSSDVHTPEKYGIYQSVGDTTGPGGIFRAMRTVPIYEYFATKIKEICPNSWVINLTNPMALCVKTLYDVFPQIKAFGCCHEVFHTQDFLCAVLFEMCGINVNRHDIYTNVIGINHFTWIDKAKYKDINILSLLDKFMDKYYISGYNERGNNDAYKTDTFSYANRVKMDMYKRYGVLGAAGDRHLVEFMNNTWYLASKSTINDWKFALTTVDFRIERMEERIIETIKLANGEIKMELKHSDEEIVDLMKAVLGMKQTISNVNLPNVGQMDGVSIGAIVETNALFNHDLITPINAGKLPLDAHNLLLRNLNNQESCYQAIKNRDLYALVNVFMNQPLCSSLTLDDGKKLFTEMLTNTRKYLDSYFKINDFISTNKITIIV